jgi:hypothetical protein
MPKKRDETSNAHCFLLWLKRRANSSQSTTNYWSNISPLLKALCKAATSLGIAAHNPGCTPKSFQPHQSHAEIEKPLQGFEPYNGFIWDFNPPKSFRQRAEQRSTPVSCPFPLPASLIACVVTSRQQQFLRLSVCILQIKRPGKLNTNFLAVLKV